MKIIILCSICFAIGWIIGNHRKPDGYFKCGKNKETGQTVYRIEVGIPYEEIPEAKDILLKVVHTSENLGINRRLYDLEDEGIKRD